MDVGLVIAGVICVAMAFGHETIGVVWVLPSLSEEHLPRTPFGSPSMTVSMLKVTFHVVTIFVLGLGVLFIALAWAPSSDAKTFLLRLFAVMWLVATAMAILVATRGARGLPGLRGLLRLPVPLLWVVIAVLCWNASI
jgi:hypothetical protein